MRTYRTAVVVITVLFEILFFTVLVRPPLQFHEAAQRSEEAYKADPSGDNRASAENFRVEAARVERDYLKKGAAVALVFVVPTIIIGLVWILRAREAAD